MSGPKKSRWQIAEERRREREAEKRRKREAQIQEIEKEISLIMNEVSKLDESTLTNIVKNWISEIRSYFNGDIRISFKELRKLKKYVAQQKEIITFERKKLKQEEIKQQKISKIIEDLDEILEDYKEILNDAILQRVRLFKESIKTNPDNKNTLTQISNFKQQLSKMYEDYLKNQEELKEVKSSFEEIFNTNAILDENGNYVVNGEIEGVNIKVKINKNHNIDFDTPLDGSCKRAIEKINDSLQHKGIELGAIQVVKTGEVLNYNSNNKQNRIKA